LGLTVLLVWGGGRAEAEVTLPAAQAVVSDCSPCHFGYKDFSSDLNASATYGQDGYSSFARVSSQPASAVQIGALFSGTVAQFTSQITSDEGEYPMWRHREFSVVAASVFFLEIQSPIEESVPLKISASGAKNFIASENFYNFSYSFSRLDSTLIIIRASAIPGMLSEAQINDQYERYGNYGGSLFFIPSLLNRNFDSPNIYGNVNENFTLSQTFDTPTNMIFMVFSWTDLNIIADIGIYGPPYDPSILSDFVSFQASAFIDATFTIDPAFPDAGRLTLSISDGIGNSAAVPEPAIAPVFALLLGAGLLRRARPAYSAAAGATPRARRRVPKSSARYTTGVV